MHTPTAPDEAKGDMTSMIDVVFLMIVFFVCIDFKVLEAKLDAFLPTDKGSGPSVVEPVEQLSVAIHVVDEGHERPHRAGRAQLVGHRVRWQVGPVTCHDVASVRNELQRIADDPTRLVPDPQTGGKKRMACVVEGYRGSRYDDVARTADLCRAAGFDDITFGGGLGPK